MSNIFPCKNQDSDFIPEKNKQTWQQKKWFMAGDGIIQNDFYANCIMKEKFPLFFTDDKRYSTTKANIVFKMSSI